MQFALTQELPQLPPPEAVSKTDRSVTMRLAIQALGPNPPKKFKFQVAWSEHGYVYYSWIESELFPTPMCPIKNLAPNTNYVVKARVVNEEAKTCGEWSTLSAYIRTFTEEEDAKRSGTYFEHALKMEREQKSKLQTQITKLTRMLDSKDPKQVNKMKFHEDMLSSRRIMDTTIHQLQQELTQQSASLHALKNQRTQDEQMIIELLNEQEQLRAAQKQQQQAAVSSLTMQSEVQRLQQLVQQNESLLAKHQQQVVSSQDQIQQYEHSLQQKKQEIAQKEQEVEKLMHDCNRMVQEQADIAQAKQLELEDALMEAKTSLEQQLEINTYLRDEVTRLRDANTQLKKQIEEMDTEIAPKLMRLEDENEELKRALGRS